MKKYILPFIFGAFAMVASAQVSLGYSIGYGTTDMQEMSDYLEQRVLETSYLGMGRVTKDFGNPVIHSIDVAYRTGKEVFGGQVSFMNTKGQLVYPDLMGEGEEDYTVSALRMGTFYRYHFHEIRLGESRAVSFYGEISPGILITSVKQQNTTHNSYGNTSQTEESNSVIGFSVLPFAGAEVNVFGDLSLRMAIGYDLALGGRIDSVNKSKVGWSGFRAKFGISYTL